MTQHSWAISDFPESCGKVMTLYEACCIAKAMMLNTWTPTERQKEQAINAFNIFLNGGVRK